MASLYKEDGRGKGIHASGIPALSIIFYLLVLELINFHYLNNDSALLFGTFLTPVVWVLAVSFYSKHYITLRNIKLHLVEILSGAAFVIIPLVFFLVKDAEEGFTQTDLANFGTFFGGIVTPLGILVAIYETRKNNYYSISESEITKIKYALECASIPYDRIFSHIDLYKNSINVLCAKKVDLSTLLEADANKVFAKDMFERLEGDIKEGDRFLAMAINYKLPESIDRGLLIHPSVLGLSTARRDTIEKSTAARKALDELKALLKNIKGETDEEV